MIDPLAPLIADGIIDQVLSRLKSGKEADIYLVAQGSAVYAAKIYKERQQRSFQNNADYKEGRAVRNTRTQRAMDKGSRFGRQADEEAWKAKESEALDRLHAAGVRVPKPHLFYEGVLLMEVVVDAAGQPAPRIVDAGISAEQARGLYLDLRQQIQRILLQDLIHGDLSPYNVLLAVNGPTIIDFPQVVGAAHNSRAEFFFRRDLEGIQRFFGTIDPELRAAAGDAQEIWRAYVRRELTPEFAPSGRPPAPVGPVDRPPLRGGSRPHDRRGPPAPGGARGRGAPPPPASPGRPPRPPATERLSGPPAAGGSALPRRPPTQRPGAGRPFPRPPANGPVVVSYVGRSPPGNHPVVAPTSIGPAAPPADPGLLTTPNKRRRRRRRKRGGGAPVPPATS